MIEGYKIICKECKNIHSEREFDMKPKDLNPRDIPDERIEDVVKVNRKRTFKNIKYKQEQIEILCKYCNDWKDYIFIPIKKFNGGINENTNN